jgi:hypothetical protein
MEGKTWGEPDFPIQPLRQFATFKVPILDFSVSFASFAVNLSYFTAEGAEAREGRHKPESRLISPFSFA